MPSNFSDAERLVAMAVSARPTDTANENDIEAGWYMAAVARVVMLDDLSDKMMASLGREILQQYIADTKSLVMAAQDGINEQQAEDRRHARSDYRELTSEAIH